MTDDPTEMPPPDPNDQDGRTYESTLTEPSKTETPEDDEEADDA